MSKDDFFSSFRKKPDRPGSRRGEGAVARDDAMAQVDYNCPEWWKEKAYEAVRAVAMERRELTSEHCREKLVDEWGIAEWREPRIWGPVMEHCSDKVDKKGSTGDRLLLVTRYRGQFRPYRNKTRHASPAAVWISLRPHRLPNEKEIGESGFDIEVESRHAWGEESEAANA